MPLTENLVVYRNEPLLNLLGARNSTPVKVGWSFFIIVSLWLTILVMITAADGNLQNYVSYWENISWPLSILFIFPFVIGLTLKYYNAIPGLFNSLSTNLEGEERQRFNKFISRLDSVFNYSSVTVGIFIFVTYVNVQYYYLPMFEDGHYSWIIYGKYVNDGSGFSIAGAYSCFIQILLVYWIAQLVYKSIVFSWGLYAYFNIHKFEVPMDPLHQDQASGMSCIWEVSLILNKILFLLGVYLSLKVIDKLIMLDQSLFSDIGNPLFLSCYVILAPSLFLLPLIAPRKRMKEKKAEFIQPLRDRYSEGIKKERDEKSGELNALLDLDKTITRLEKKIAIWPFNTKSVQSFAATIVTPLIPIVLTVIVDYIRTLFMAAS